MWGGGMGRLFGTDGIRGEANLPPMMPETALRLGRALAARFGGRASGAGRARIVIGKDTRLSGYMLEQALASGICATGADVWLCGPLPTPGIAFITTSMRADAGVVISASHNPYHDNGIKVFGHDGFKLPDEDEAAIEAMVMEDRIPRGAMRADLGRAHRIDEAWARYVVFLKRVLPDDLDLDGLKIVVDCAHGAAYRVAPAVLEELGAQVVTIGVKPDGLNINAGCGSLHPERMCDAIRLYGADMGLALDGDADRVIIADERGSVIDGDQLMAINALAMHEEGTLRDDTVVATVMSNLGLERSLKNHGIRLLRTQVGDRNVVKAMREGGYNVGGEQSGHLVFLDHTSTGDGVVAGLKTLTVMLRTGKRLSELAAVMERVPQVLVNVPVASKPPIEELPDVISVIQGIEASMGGEGRVLVRYSGTEPKARVMLEGLDVRQIEQYAHDIAAALRQSVGQ